MRNRRFIFDGEAFWKIHRTAIITINAAPKPTIGDRNIGRTTLLNTESQYTPRLAARPAPTKPPIRAWVDEDGSPNHQVIRFQTIAPTNAAMMTIKAVWLAEIKSAPVAPPGGSRLTISLAIVSATSVPNRAPTKFMIAAIISAALGVKARVDTEVAIAFAAS